MPVATAKAHEDGDVLIINPEGPHELVMFVDDDDLITVLVQRLLTDEGYRVITARDGFQTLDIYKKLQAEVQLVILDFVMPIMNGSELFNELRMINPHVSVLLTSGYAEHDKFTSLFTNGLRGFIQKPMNQKKFLLQVRSVLDAKDYQPAVKR